MISMVQESFKRLILDTEERTPNCGDISNLRRKRKEMSEGFEVKKIEDAHRTDINRLTQRNIKN
jgi:hypothetical protein